jgi:hypothetical protein
MKTKNPICVHLRLSAAKTGYPAHRNRPPMAQMRIVFPGVVSSRQRIRVPMKSLIGVHRRSSAAKTGFPAHRNRPPMAQMRIVSPGVEPYRPIEGCRRSLTEEAPSPIWRFQETA